VNQSHPVFRDCQIFQIGRSKCIRAAQHATFNASILIGNDEAKKGGRVMAICSGCTLFNFAVVMDEMLDGCSMTRSIASVLAWAVDSAVQAKCHVIVFGIEILQADSRQWTWLRESIVVALASGAVVVVPAGNPSRVQAATPACWPDVLVAASHDWRGNISRFSAFPARSGNMIFAPGEDVPGADPASEYVVQSGTSFAAAITAGAFGLARVSRIQSCSGLRGSYV
jgi:hypothetical protein